MLLFQDLLRILLFDLEQSVLQEDFEASGQFSKELLLVDAFHRFNPLPYRVRVELIAFFIALFPLASTFVLIVVEGVVSPLDPRGEPLLHVSGGKS